MFAKPGVTISQFKRLNGHKYRARQYRLSRAFARAQCRISRSLQAT